MTKISGVIIAYNEEQYIAKCLESLQGIVDEILVVDSFSTDETLQICEKHGARVIQRAFIGFTDQKNYATEQAKFDYVLSLDADEALSEELKASILELKPTMDGEGYAFNILNHYCGKWIHHSSWYPGTKIRLYNKHKARWYSPTNIHETITLDNPKSVVKLKGDLLHWAYDSFSEHHLKIDTYTTLSAVNYVKNKSKKVPYTKIIINPFWKFFKNYFINRGFLDGFQGFVICCMSGYTTFLKYIKIIELQQNEKHHLNR